MNLQETVVLMIDDEVEICELVTIYLNKEGYRTYCVYDGRSALATAEKIQPDIILLDVLLPGLDGFEVCSQLRRHTDVPIIFMSCKGEELDKVIALGVGGDDYIVKPFSFRELVARVKAHLRRQRQFVKKEELEFGDLKIDLMSHSVYHGGVKIKISSREFDILLLLAQNPGVLYSAEQIFRCLWSIEDVEDTRTVLVHISNLRKKIEKDPSQPAYILTDWGAGYYFNSVWRNERQGITVQRAGL